MKTWKIVLLLVVPPFIVIAAIVSFSVIGFVGSSLVMATGTVATLSLANVALGLLGLIGLVATPIGWTIAIVALIRRK